MASKTIDNMDFYVAIAGYQLPSVPDQTFNSLRVSVGYRKGSGFYASFHPGWGSGSMWGCVFDFSKDPLSSGMTVEVEPATKNNAKRIAEMTESLKMAKDIIAALFDDREWQKLKGVLQNAAKFGYTEKFKEQGEAYLAARVSKRYEKAVKPTEPSEPVVKQVDVMGLMGALQTKGKAKLSDFAKPIESESNEKENNSNQETMAQNVKAADLIGKVIIVGNNQGTITVKSVQDNGMLACEFKKTDSDAITPMAVTMQNLQAMTERGLWKLKEDGGSKTEDVHQTSAVSPQTSEVTTDADVAEVDDIAPKVTPRAKPEEPKSEEPKSEEPTAKVTPIGKPKQEKPKKNTNPTNQTNKGGKYVYSTYLTSKGKTGAKITGVSETDAAYQQASSIHASGSYTKDKDGNKYFYLCFGPRYAEAAKKVCELLNAGKPIEDAIAVVNAATEERAVKREEARVKREERKAQISAVSLQPSKGYSDKDVAEMLRKVLAGGDVPEDIKALMKQAA